ncbi:MAG: helix-turn-helix domain-containing protein [Candidatus Micrarchaeaceae archaeon]
MQKTEVCEVSKLISGASDLNSLKRVITGHWHISILEILGAMGETNYNGIYKVSGLNPKTLSSVLKELEKLGFVRRSVVEKRPLSVYYSITDKGRRVISANCPFIKGGY